MLGGHGLTLNSELVKLLLLHLERLSQALVTTLQLYDLLSEVLGVFLQRLLKVSDICL